MAVDAKRRVNGEAALLRKESRYRLLNSMRSFPPHEARKFLAMNPNQPSTPAASPSFLHFTNSSAEEHRHSLAETARPHDSTPADEKVAEEGGPSPPLTHWTSQTSVVYYRSVPTIVPRAKSRSQTESQLGASSTSLIMDGASPHTQSLTALHVNYSEAASGGTMPPVTAPSIGNEDNQFVLLQHQEAIYRQMLFPEVDNWFTSLVEAAWDERDRLVLSAEEEVQRYWLMSDELNALETLEVYKRNAEVQMHRGVLVAELTLEELVARSHVSQEYFADVAVLESLMLEDLQLCQCAAMERRHAEAALLQQQKLEEELPPIARTPRPPAASAKDADASKRRVPSTPPHQTGGTTPSSPRTETHTVAGHSEPAAGGVIVTPTKEGFNSAALSTEATARAMNNFLFGPSPALFQFVLDAEDSIRSKIEVSEDQQRQFISAQVRNYNDATALLRRPYGYRALTLEEAEQAERRVLASTFYDMLLQAVATLEVLTRREIMIRDDPQRRKELASKEREEWLHARRIECARKMTEDRITEDQLKASRMTNYHVEQQLSKQRHLFERAEGDERFEVIRREARSWALLMEEATEDRLIVNQYQLRFERRKETVVWTPESYEAVYLKESSNRSNTMREEKEAFLVIQSKEVSSYVHSRRNMLINQDVEAQLRGYDEAVAVASLH